MFTNLVIKINENNENYRIYELNNLNLTKIKEMLKQELTKNDFDVLF